MCDKFYKDGLKFECQRCSFCCGHSPGFVYLSQRDLTVLCEHFNLKIKGRINQMAEIAPFDLT